MSIYLTVLCNDKGIIGKNNRIPFSFHDDLKYFRKLSKDNIVLMGSKTYDTVLNKFVRNRKLFILSNKKYNNVADSLFFYSIPNVLSYYNLRHRDKNLIIYGGESIFNQFLSEDYYSFIDKIFVRKIKGDYKGDKFFVNIPNCFVQENIEKHKNFSLITYVNNLSSSFIQYTDKERLECLLKMFKRVENIKMGKTRWKINFQTNKSITPLEGIDEYMRNNK